MIRNAGDCNEWLNEFIKVKILDGKSVAKNKSRAICDDSTN
jgi:hypothetical protein